MAGSGQRRRGSERQVHASRDEALPVREPGPRAKPAAERPGRERPAEVEHDRDGQEDEAENEDLHGGSTACRVDELRQEGDEEQRNLGVQDVDEDALRVRAPEGFAVVRPSRSSACPRTSARMPSPIR